jgi:hypothetical protein
MSMDSHGVMILKGKTELLGGKPVPMQLCPPQIPQTDPDANPGLHGKRPATNRLSHGTGYEEYKH